MKLLKEERAKARQQRNAPTADHSQPIKDLKSRSCVEENDKFADNSSSGSIIEVNFHLREGFGDSFRIGTIPSSFYISNAFDEVCEEQLLSAIEWSGNCGDWITLSTRRLQLHGKIPESKKPMPAWLTTLLNSNLSNLYPPDFIPNNVLINQYEADQGIMHHTDGPAFKNFVIILSLESDCIMTFKPKLLPSEIGLKPDTEVMAVYLHRRSVFIFSEDLYSHYMHGICDAEEVEIGQSCPCVNLEVVNQQHEKVNHTCNFFVFF